MWPERGNKSNLLSKYGIHKNLYMQIDIFQADENYKEISGLIFFVKKI